MCVLSAIMRPRFHNYIHSYLEKIFLFIKSIINLTNRPHVVMHHKKCYSRKVDCLIIVHSVFFSSLFTRVFRTWFLRCGGGAAFFRPPVFSMCIFHSTFTFSPRYILLGAQSLCQSIDIKCLFLLGGKYVPSIHHGRTSMLPRSKREFKLLGWQCAHVMAHTQTPKMFKDQGRMFRTSPPLLFRYQIMFWFEVRQLRLLSAFLHVYVSFTYTKELIFVEWWW